MKSLRLEVYNCHNGKKIGQSNIELNSSVLDAKEGRDAVKGCICELIDNWKTIKHSDEIVVPGEDTILNKVLGDIFKKFFNFN